MERSRGERQAGAARQQGWQTARSRGEHQAAAAREQGWQSASWRALGTSVQLVVTDHLQQARAEVERVLDEMDRAASRFREDSELRRLPPNTWTEVSPLCARAVQVARDAAVWTGGLVDPTVGLSMVDLGYDRTFRQVASAGPAFTVAIRPAGGWERIEVDGLRVKAPYGLDLGATAKGLAADLAAEAAGRHCSAVLVSLGGDIATAGDGTWPVLVSDLADPDLTDSTGEVITLRRGGLATSSTRGRRWKRGGELVHHLLDPRTSRPTQGPWQTASVLAPTCTQANVASTAAIVSGEGAVKWLEERWHSARLVGSDGTVVRVGNWAKEVGR